MQYLVKQNLRHNGVHYTDGDVVEVSPTEAASLLEIGCIVDMAAPAQPTAEPTPAADPAPPASVPAAAPPAAPEVPAATVPLARPSTTPANPTPAQIQKDMEDLALGSNTLPAA